MPPRPTADRRIPVSERLLGAAALIGIALAAIVPAGIGAYFAWPRNAEYLGKPASVISKKDIRKRYKPPIPFDEIEKWYGVALTDQDATSEVLILRHRTVLPPYYKVRVLRVDGREIVVDEVLGHRAKKVPSKP